MKISILFIVLLTFSFNEAFTQSFEITPRDGFLSSSAPDLELTGVFAPQIRGKRIQGTLAWPAAIGAEQIMLDIVGAGYNGSSFYDQAAIRMSAASYWTDTLRGTKMSFFTTKNNSPTMRERMVLSDNGYLGINVPNPQVPFHINYSNSTSNSSTGTAIFGELTDRHLNFSRLGIDAYDGTSSAALFLNSSSSGAVLVGGLFNTSDFQVTGFTQLGTGSDVPKIKMKELTGTTSSSQSGQVDILHGISDASKIISVDIIVYTGSSYLPPNTTDPIDHEYNYHYGDTKIHIRNRNLNSDFILNKPIKILIAYKE